MGANLIALIKSHLPAIEKMDGSILQEETPKALALKRPALKDVDEHMVSSLHVVISGALTTKVLGPSGRRLQSTFPVSDS